VGRFPGSTVYQLHRQGRAPHPTRVSQSPRCVIVLVLLIRVRVDCLGIPLRAKEDTWYDSMLIPAYATIILPVYAFHPTHYADPATYNPDRYLENSKK
jgi:hypothetical protein